MANRIKGITVEIGGDTTGLDKALKGINSTIKNTQSQLRDVNRLLKLDPSNAKLLAQKQQLLQKEISETSEKLNALGKSTITKRCTCFENSRVKNSACIAINVFSNRDIDIENNTPINLIFLWSQIKWRVHFALIVDRRNKIFLHLFDKVFINT